MTRQEREGLHKVTVRLPDVCFALKQLDLAMQRAAESMNKFCKTVNTPGLRKVLKDANN